MRGPDVDVGIGKARGIQEPPDAALEQVAYGDVPLRVGQEVAEAFPVELGHVGVHRNKGQARARRVAPQAFIPLPEQPLARLAPEGRVRKEQVGEPESLRGARVMMVGQDAKGVDAARESRRPGR